MSENTIDLTGELYEMFTTDLNKQQDDFGWNEFTLEELNLPSTDKILEGVKKIESEIGLFAWRTKDFVLQKYKGFGLTYNPTFFDKNESRYSQVFGSP